MQCILRTNEIVYRMDRAYCTEFYVIRLFIFKSQFYFVKPLTGLGSKKTNLTNKNATVLHINFPCNKSLKFVWLPYRLRLRISILRLSRPILKYIMWTWLPVDLKRRRLVFFPLFFCVEIGPNFFIWLGVFESKSVKCTLSL